MMNRAKSLQRGLTVLALVLVLLLGAAAAGTGDAYAADSAYRTGTVVIDALNVRTGAGTLNEAIGLIFMGDKVTILGSAKDYTGTVWYLVTYNGGTGYVSSDYIAIDSNNEYVYDEAFELSLVLEGFPESYKDYLRQVHADYPNWVFQAAHTGIDWNTAVSTESKPGVTLVTGTAASSWKSTEAGAYDSETGKYIQYDSGNWVTASRAIIEYYMDPRNFLNHGGIFQFMAHSYDGRTQTAEGLQGVLDGTFMSGAFPEETHATYNDVLMEVGRLTEVNPYVLASMILVEQGNTGIGKSISGTVSGYEGYYNHFNVGAYKSGGMDAVTRGLWYASQSGTFSRPWDSIYKSICGGASFYSENYVKNNKNTLYFKKFNVMNGAENVGKGQYMTNVQGAESEAAALRKGYLSVMDSAMTFIIPVYENMPETACLKPAASASNDNYLASLSVENFSLSPVFDRNITDYTVTVPYDAAFVKIDAAANNAGASVYGTGYIAVTAAEQTADITVTAASGVQKVYSIKIKRASQDPDGSIRAAVENTSIKVSSNLSEGVISLSWSVTGTEAMDYYEVFRSIKKSSGYGTKAYYTTADGAVLTMSDSGNFEVGNTYYYKVRGVRMIDGKAVYTPWSTKSWRTVKELPAVPQIPEETPVIPSVPDSGGSYDDPESTGGSQVPEDNTPVSSTARGVMATTIDLTTSKTESGKVRLDWKKSPGYKVDYYEVFRAEGSESNFGEKAYFKNSSGDSLYYINTGGLKAGNTYYYKVRGVRSVDGQLVYTRWSNVSFQTIDGAASQDPDGTARIGVEATTVELSASLTSSGKIRLDWSKSPGYKIDYYEVYRSTKKSSGYGTKPFYTTSNGTGNYYINTGRLVSGTTYYYKVRGVRVIDGQKVYTKWSNKSWKTAA